MAQTMTIKPYLRVYTGSDMHYRFDDESEEWYNDRDMRYFDRYDYSDEDSEEEAEDIRYNSNEMRGEEKTATQSHMKEATDSSNCQYGNFQQTQDNANDHEEAGDNNTETDRRADPLAYTQTAYQTQTQTQTQYDLSYYGYGDYDFGQLSRVTTAFNIHDFMDPNPTNAAEDGDNEGDDEEEDEGEEEEEEDAGDADDMSMANRRWHCPRPQR